MRTITHSEFVNGAGEGVYVSHVHYSNPAERKAGDAACQGVVAEQEFTPFGHAGEAQDPPEHFPPNCEGDNRHGQAAEILIELTEGDE